MGHILIIAFILFAHSLNAFAGGYEKLTLIPGRTVSISQGSQAVFYNPAGLARTRGAELSFDGIVSAVWASAPLFSVNGNATQGADPIRSDLLVTPAAQTFLSYEITPRWGVGFGLFGSGGLGVDYGEVNFNSAFSTLKPKNSAKAAFIEGSLGMGYEVLPGFRLGAAWRAMMIRNEIKAGAPLDLNLDGSPDLLASIETNNLSDFVFNGFRFGAQYEPENSFWGVGVVLRTATKFKVEGETTGKFQRHGSTNIESITGGKLALESEFPLKGSVGFHLRPSPKVRVHTEYSFTHNTNNKSLVASGDGLAFSSVVTLPASSVFTKATHWRNEHALRFGGQAEVVEDWILQGEYAFATQVVPNHLASAFSSPPGMEHAFALGVLTKIMAGKADLQIAATYDFMNGTGSNSQLGSLNGRYHQSSAAGLVNLTRRF